MRYTLIQTILIVCSSIPQSLKAQSVQQAPEIEIVSATPRGCQRNTINIANLGALAQTTKEKVFVIARLGKGELSHQLNRCRLNSVKTEFGSNWNPSHIMLAEGERTNGQGRIEFYLGSNLMSVSLMARNGDFCSSCCDKGRIFYK